MVQEWLQAQHSEQASSSRAGSQEPHSTRQEPELPLPGEGQGLVGATGTAGLAAGTHLPEKHSWGFFSARQPGLEPAAQLLLQMVGKVERHQWQ